MPSVNYEVRSNIASIQLNEPQKRNPLNVQLVTEFIAALERARADEEVRVVLLSAAGDSFCAGGDLKEFQNFSKQPVVNIYEEGRGTTELLKKLGTFPKPIVAAVNGPAFGGGFGVACACSIVIASDRAKFGATELKLGLFPLVILPAMRRTLGDRKALEMCLTTDVLDAPQAERVGVVTRVVPHDQLIGEAEKMVSKIASFSPHALKLGVEAFRTSTGMSLEQATDYLNSLRVMFYHSEDLKEGATAFLEKRVPNWVGR
ncbi:enoyl-CoA hydratase/isomerase family protein [Bradyrhizobium sp. LHD-71]|uniref:enoyl-CoA hydratase/isomerase family protein n=1 Tax=Bradyrhizobium sp. LHD-71 TaxID=3072141 RepID=UPI00280E9D6F|nr:enoyl-CoA hydratase/isomerase family protein [Bradyrhizobium sp. LHD-71]MDQ8727417.1 enoyl-CoA hydratase/isomerase family protein [Bradyrhizobium sp. LHD-71]